MIYVTGDLHGDITRFKSKGFRKIKRNDYLIICGDFGFMWEGTPEEKKIWKWIGKRKYNVLFVEGVHDNLTLLSAYKNTKWNGGDVKVISGKLKYLCRGGVFDIGGTKIFAFGGGENISAVDTDFQSNWWERQLPTKEEVDKARKNLKESGNKVDYIVSHQPSRKTKKLITMEDKEANVLDTFFDEVRVDCDFKGWFFGNYHEDRVIPPREAMVFQRVIPLKNEFKDSVSKKK